MGIYFEHKLLRPNPDGSEMEKRFHGELEEVRALFKQHGGVIVLLRDSERVWDVKKESYRPFVPYSLPVEVYLYLDSMGSVSVRYSKNAPIYTDGKQYTYVNNRIFIEDRLHLTEEQIDLAWFILKATKFVELVDKDGTPIKEQGSNRFLRIDNPLYRVKKETSKLKKIAKLDSLIYFDDSPLYDLDTVKRVANQLGVTVQLDHIDIAVHQLRSAIMKGEETNNPDVNIDKFVAAASRLAKVDYPTEWDGKIPEEGFKEIQLRALNYAELNRLSDHLGTKKPPKCNKETQIKEILEHKPETVEE